MPRRLAGTHSRGKFIPGNDSQRVGNRTLKRIKVELLKLVPWANKLLGAVPFNMARPWCLAPLRLARHVRESTSSR